VNSSSRAALVRVRRFAAFCRTNGYAMRQEEWGKERTSRAYIGSEPEAAAGAIDRCFGAVFNEIGPCGWGCGISGGKHRLTRDRSST
jgi:hypothetical protein